MSEDFSPRRLPGPHGPLTHGDAATGRYSPSEPVSGEGGGLSVRELLLVARRHWLLIGSITLVVTALTAWLVLSAVPQYRAVAALRLVDQGRMMSGGLETGMSEGLMGWVDPVQSEIQILRSRHVMGGVVEDQGLRLVTVDGDFPRAVVSNVRVATDAPGDTVRLRYHDAEYEVSSVAGSARVPYGQHVSVGAVEFTVLARPGADEALLRVDPFEPTLQRLTRKFQTRVRPNTDVVDIDYTHADPVLAQRVVNSAARLFRERNIELAQQMSRRRREFVEARLAETELTLDQAQQALSGFQVREQVFSSKEKFAAQQVTLFDLEMRRAELLAERGMFTGLLERLASGANTEDALRTVVSSPSLGENAVIRQLYEGLVRYQLARDSMSARGSSPTNPDVVRVNRLIASTQGDLVGALRAHVAMLDARVSAADEMRRRHAGELAAMPSAQAEEASLTLQVQTIVRLADQLREEAQRARIAEAIEAGKVDIIDYAAVPADPVDDRAPLKLMLGLMVGLMLGGGAALLRDQLNMSLKTRDDVESHLQLPGLSVIPQFGTTSNLRLPRLQRLRIRSASNANLPVVHNGNGNGAAAAPPAQLVTLTDPQSPPAEAYRKLRTNIIFSQSERPLRTLVLTSTEAGEGKSTTAANLAVSFAQQGIRVLLIDGDLRRPTLHRIFGITKIPGLSDLVLERATVSEVVRPTSAPGLFVVPSGVLPPNPGEMVAGTRMRSAIQQLRGDFDIVIFDTPPVLAATEGPVLAVRADAAILVLRAAHTDRRAAQLAVRQLRTVGANVIGVVLNDPDGKVPKFGFPDAYYNTYYGAHEEIPARTGV
jgi:capsular exopolysaccharide synthesis family protein